MKYHLNACTLISLLSLAGLVSITIQLQAQDQPIIIEAESGVAGSDFILTTEGGVTFVSPKTDLAGSTSPGNATKIITFTVTFQSPGTYDLFARLNVGAGAGNDDSFYYGNGFGAKAATNDADWIRVNNIGGVGASLPDEVVGGTGTASGGIWKWINLSEFLGDEAPITFIVTAPNTQLTFQYGSRENGLALDKLAFGKANLYYTVSNLENAEAGSTFIPGGVGDPSLSRYQLVETYTNPILPGDHPDLTLLKVGNDFYSCGSSFHFTPYLPILHSKDLVHWEEISRVIPAEWHGLANDAPGQGIWQGAITYFYNSYWIYFSNTAGGGQYFSKASTPAGPWSTPVKMNTTSSTGPSGYDNSVFVDDDGTPYMTIKPGQYTNRIQKIGSDGHLVETVVNLDWVNANGQYSWAEGPVMCKKDGWYYYFIAGNVSGGQYVLRSQTLSETPSSWEAMGNFFAPINDPLAAMKGANHISQPFQLTDGTWWVISHSYENGSGNDWSGQGRQGLLHQVTWGTNGKPTGMAPVSSPLVKPNLLNEEISWKLPRSDYFTGNTLKLSWHFLNKKSASQYSLTERPGWLRIKPGSERSHVLHNDAGHFYSLVTRVNVDATVSGEEAGIYLTNGNESLAVKLYSGFNNGKKIGFRFGTTIYEIPNTIGNTVWLKLARKEHSLDGFYSLDGFNWTQVGSSILISDLDKAQPNFNSWVGNSHGAYAERKIADFDLFLYRDGFSVLRAEGYNNYYGVQSVANAVGNAVTNTTKNGGWLMLGGVDLGEAERTATAIDVVASASTGGSLEVWLDDIEAAGKKIATIQINNTGVGTWSTFTAPVSDITGQHDVYLKFVGDAQCFFINTIRFVPAAIVTGSNESVNEKLLVYPNPFHDGFRIETNSGQHNYEIYDITGNVVDQGINKQPSELIGSKLNSGLYILKISSKTKNSFIRLVKRSF